MCSIGRHHTGSILINMGLMGLLNAVGYELFAIAQFPKSTFDEIFSMYRIDTNI